MEKIRVELWSEFEFGNAQEVWADLLERSKSDELFMSWEWLFSWWDTFANKDNDVLHIIAAYDESNILVGLAPLFISSATSKKIIRTQRLQFIGNFWRGSDTMRTELLDFIADSAYSKQVIEALFDYINSMTNWDEFILSDLDKSSVTYQVLFEKKILDNVYYRNVEEYDSYYLEIGSSFDGFCKLLGKNTRLSLLNRRKILEKMGRVEYIEADCNAVGSQFILLNTLHMKRWGKPVFEGVRLNFNINVATLMAKKNQLQFSIILLNNIPISMQYNYVVNGHEYNIQAGFNESLHNKISLGYLHFGYAIESAFKKGLRVYDFLAGEGKNTPYKKRLTADSKVIACIQIIRNKHLRKIYYVYDLFNTFCDKIK